MSNPNPPAASAARGRSLGWIGWGALLGYAIFIGWHTAVVAGGADSSGYLNSARLFAEGRLVEDLRAPPEFGPRAALDALHFLPQGFYPARDRASLTPTYPTGLPLHFAAAGKTFGWHVGPLLIAVLSAAAAVGLCYLTARELGVSGELAAAGAVMLALFPVYVFTSVQPLSDTLATTWSLAALFAALRTQRAGLAGGSLPATSGETSPRESRRPGCGWALGAGASFAMAVLVRPTNLLLAPALLVLLGRDWRRLTAFVLGGLPGAVWLAFYNYRLYGHPLSSGYGDIFAAFALGYGAPTSLHFARWLATLLPAVVLLLPWAALRHRAAPRRELLALGLMFVAIAGCYAFYEVSHEVWWCLRFILPAVPALILAALLGVEALAAGPGRRWPGAFRRGAALLLALWSVGIAIYWLPHLSVLQMKNFEQAYADAALAARQRLPAGSLVVCSAFSGALYYYTDFAVLRSDQIEAPAFARYAAQAGAAGRPLCAVLFDSEEAEAFRRCPGQWTRLALVRNVGLWQFTKP